MASSERGLRPGRLGTTALAMAAALVLSRPATAAPPADVALIGPDGSAVSVIDLVRGRDATVLVFLSAGCPCVRRYQARADALLDAYPRERVQVLSVLSNAGEAPEAARAEAARRRVRLPLWHDPGGRLAAALGARSTPTVAVLDGGGTLRYLGWIDNERRPGEAGREAWLEDALGALLAGDPTPRRRKAFGCPITRALGGAPRRPCCAVSAP